MSTYKFMVFSGGGTAGVAFAGAVEQLAQEPSFSFKDIDSVAGTSIGALAALMICLNYTPEEINQQFANIDLRTLADGGNLLSQFIRLLRQQSLYEGKALTQLIKNILKEKVGNESATFGDLQRLGFKNLYLVTTKLYKLNGSPDGKKKVFSAKKHFNTSVADIVLASAAATPYFPSVYLKKIEKGKYIATNHEGYRYVDGGFSNNYDINFFDKPEFIEKADDKDKYQVNNHTLGLALLNSDQIINREYKPVRKPTSGIFEFLYAIFNTLIGPFKNENVVGNYVNEKRSIQIDKLNVSLADFNMSNNTKQALVQSGKNAVIEYFRQKPKANDGVIFAEKKVSVGKMFTSSSAGEDEKTLTPQKMMKC